jgi:hypothetical protein
VAGQEGLVQRARVDAVAVEVARVKAVKAVNLLKPLRALAID